MGRKRIEKYIEKNIEFTELKIINSLRIAMDLVCDGGPGYWEDGEYEAVQEYLDYLQNRITDKGFVTTIKVMSRR